MVDFVVNLLPAAFLFLLHGHTPVLGGHVLVFPAEYSHWLNMRTIMEELVARNHTVTVLVADQSPSVDYNSSKDAAKFNFMVFKVKRAYTRTPTCAHTPSDRERGKRSCDFQEVEILS